MTPHPSVVTPPPYKNNQEYKGGTNDKTHDSQTHESGVSRSDDASLTRNLDAENKNAEDDEYIDHLSIINMIESILNHMKKTEKYYYFKKKIKSNKFDFFDIDQDEKEILVVNYNNEKLKLKINGIK